ncbi:MAG: thioredoxin family protein [Bdellovibrionales bacterium]|nr:thioredoxin family protein [Oligoflexia bacterium]
MKLLFTLISLIALHSTAIAGNSPPDFKVEVGEDQNAKMRGWLLLFTPPEHHHFNVQAPMKVTADAVPFIKVGATEAKVGYRSSNPTLKEGQKVEASLFLCDNAKTYCMKKTLAFELKTNSALHQLDFPLQEATPVVAPKPKKKKAAQKDEFGFWDNDPESAIKEAVKTHRPIFIDFYGIWCPPCNLFSETVFPKAKFRNAAKSWVLLKMDADRPESFDLKSHFKIGGYPTLIAAKSPGAQSSTEALVEIDRMVGFYPLSDLVVKMNGLYQDRLLTLDEKLNAQKEHYGATLKQLIRSRAEQKATQEALNLSEEGMRAFPQDHFYPLQALAIRAEDKSELLKESTNGMLLKAVLSNRERESSETLLIMEDLLVSHKSGFTPEELSWGLSLLDTLKTRVNPGTLSVPGVELSIADIDSMRVDLAEALKDEALQKKSYVDGVASYQKMIALQQGAESRGLNLELAYLYWKSGEPEKAKKLYSHFIAKYPREFTFYFAASRMYLDLKEYKIARDYAEKAVKYSYGDNQIRSMERLVRVMNAQGEKKQAVDRAQDFLAKNKRADEKLAIRTNRYFQALEKAVDEVGKI